MHSLIEENYLKALFHLSQQNGEVNINELSKNLSVKMPTANSMMKKLAEKKLVIYQVYKPIRLTIKGKKEAGKIVRKHRLTEMFLVDKMGFAWDEVHEIAEQVEHIQSPVFFEKMDMLLGHPTVDPHGSPIPDKNGNVVAHNYIKLSDVAIGQTAIFCSVYNANDDFLRYLTSKEIQLNTAITVHKIEAYDGNISISYPNHLHEVISRAVASQLMVIIIQ